jgi:hypothetical protein
MYVGKKEKEVRKDQQTGDHMTNFSNKKNITSALSVLK